MSSGYSERGMSWSWVRGECVLILGRMGVKEDAGDSKRYKERNTRMEEESVG